MTPSRPSSETAFRVAEQIHAPQPWEVFAQRIQRFEVHLAGTRVEMVRGPITLEGYGIRVLRPREGKTGAGFQASTDLSAAGIRATLEDAESVARVSEFPAARVELPGASADKSPGPEVVDRTLWDRPLETIDAYVAEMFRGFESHREVVPSFGSVRATLSETSIANSNGLRVQFPQTFVDFEVAVKSFGEAEGPAPGEYWVNSLTRRLEPNRLSSDINDWCRYAQDVRRASPPPTGEVAVVLPASVLSGILPPVLGFRFTGAARLRKIAPTPGELVATPKLTVRDDGRFPWSPGSSPFDGEGNVRQAHPLIEQGKVANLLYDALHAGAFDSRSTASAARGQSPGGFMDWRQFSRSPSVSSSTLVVAPGDGGTDPELIETVEDGVWVQQLGWAIPDFISGAFGGEIRIGYRIRHGKLAEPVRGGTVGGFVMTAPGHPSLIQNVAAIGSHPQLAESVASPTLVVRTLTVAGENAPQPTSKADPSTGSSHTSGTAGRAGSRKRSR